MSDGPPVVRFTPRAEELARNELPDHERGALISDATSLSAGDKIVYPRDDPSAEAAFCILAVSGRVVDLGVPEEWSGVAGRGGLTADQTELVDRAERKWIHGLIHEVVSKSSARENRCVYRGEPECYPEVSSGLYRKCHPDSENEAFDIAEVEQETVETARQYTTAGDDDDILTEIQHLGGATNLIDFTDDYLVALFFASDGGKGKDGRVVLHWPEPGAVVRPKHTMNRIVSQKSVFVRPPRGFIVPDARDEIVVVPGDRKDDILEYLDRYHGISKRSVYNDIHGFIRNQAPGQSGYARAFRDSVGRSRTRPAGDWKSCFGARTIRIHLASMRHANHQRGLAYEDGRRSEVWLTQGDRQEAGPTTIDRVELDADEVVQLYTGAIGKKELADKRGELYCRRGEAHLYQGAADLAHRDFAEALDRDGNMPEAYHGRGCANKQQGKTDRAMADFERALSLARRPFAALIDRGNTLLARNSVEEAIKDFDEAVSSLYALGPVSPFGAGDGLFHRAVAHCMQQDWAAAKADFKEAKTGGVLVASSFLGVCGGVQRFEAKHGLRMPSALATMLYVASPEP